MNISNIIKMPTAFPIPGGVGFNLAHESTLRAYQILQKVKEWLENDTPPETILELIEFMESEPNTEFKP